MKRTAGHKSIQEVKKEIKFSQDLAILDEDRDPSEDFNPYTTRGRDMSPQGVHGVPKKKTKKKSPSQKPKHTPLNNRKVVQTPAINSDLSHHTNDSNSVSTSESSSSNSISSADIQVRNHLLLDKADPPANPYCSGIKLLCYYYSLTREKDFVASNIKKELARLHREDRRINWTGTDGVSRFCNEMKPKHFGKFKLLQK